MSRSRLAVNHEIVGFLRFTHFRQASSLRVRLFFTGFSAGLLCEPDPPAGASGVPHGTRKNALACRVELVLG